MKNKKAILIISLCILLVVLTVIVSFILFGGDKSVEEMTKDFLDQYVDLEPNVVDRIKYEFEDKLTSDQKKKYVSIIKKQYSDMEYKINNVRKEGHLIFVDVEIKVYDLRSAIERANSYIELYSDKFESEGKYNSEKAVNYKLDVLENAEDKISYSIQFIYQKNEDSYFMHDLYESDLKKINGTY